ncbi:MAG: hypothetical protein ACRBBW_16300 [Cellvibrionaceae bacterium]
MDIVTKLRIISETTADDFPNSSIEAWMGEAADTIEGLLSQITPSAEWRENGEPDPHGATYSCERSELALGDMTDDALANAVFLHGNHPPSVEDLIAGKARPPIVYLTAAKERIRWLSRALDKALKELAENAPN